MDFLAQGGEPAAFQLALMEKDLRLMVEAGLGQKDFSHVLSFLSLYS